MLGSFINNLLKSRDTCIKLKDSCYKELELNQIVAQMWTNALAFAYEWEVQMAKCVQVPFKHQFSPNTLSYPQ